MKPFVCMIVMIAAIDKTALLEGSLVLECAGKRLTLSIKPISLFQPWIKDWKVGDEIVGGLNDDNSCAFWNGTAGWIDLPIDPEARAVLRTWKELGRKTGGKSRVRMTVR